MPRRLERKLKIGKTLINQRHAAVQCAHFSPRSISPLRIVTAMKAYPLTFRPVLKQTIWGGRKLGDRLGKPIGPENDYAESWEVVDHGPDQSVVEHGDLAGMTLGELIRDHAVWLMGDDFENTGSFPLLLKYLDCNRVLSVQVHPDDAYAQEMTPPDLGKTEAWYVVDAEPGGLIYAGLKPGVDQARLRQAVEAGETEDVLHSFQPEPGDVVFIPAGTVHALGAGLLIAEIQQSSDTTFRLFDWNRVDANGDSRPLHIEPSLEVTDYDSGPVDASKPDQGLSGWQTLVACDKFRLKSLERGDAEVGGDGKFHVLTVPRGRATLRTESETMVLSAGQTVMLPASMPACTLVIAPEDSSSTVLVAEL